MSAEIRLTVVWAVFLMNVAGAALNTLVLVLGEGDWFNLAAVILNVALTLYFGRQLRYV